VFQGPADRKAMARYLALSQVGMEMVAPIVIGVALDAYLGWAPWATVAGAALGLCGGLAHLVHELNKGSKGPDPRREAP
jgi:F0F1-type ATP synthase assembly protein I